MSRTRTGLLRHQLYAFVPAVYLEPVVYFVERDGFVKIGYTTNLPSRVYALERAPLGPEGLTVGPVELIAVARGNARVEAMLHDKFKDDRFPGTEWFYAGDALKQEMGALLDAYCGNCDRYVQGHPCGELLLSLPDGASASCDVRHCARCGDEVDDDVAFFEGVSAEEKIRRANSVLRSELVMV